jgi:very-short-patch-repair endonuclease
VNVLVAGFEVDSYWPEHLLAVEVDSRAHHLTTAAFECDRERDIVLQLAGIRVVRITERRLLERPDAVADDVARLLAPTVYRAVDG